MYSKFARRRARGGQGLIPPNPRQWENEHNGLDLREDLSVPNDARLNAMDAFALYPTVQVLPHGEIPAAAKFIHYFRAAGKARWSGLSMTLDDGAELVIYNDAHPPSRIRATLMEEYFHLRLSHPRTAVRLLGRDEVGRTFDGEIEAEAYGSGAAALVPYCSLRSMVTEGQRVIDIAQHFEVSPDLVRFRMKVTKLYARRVRM